MVVLLPHIQKRLGLFILVVWRGDYTWKQLVRLWNDDHLVALTSKLDICNAKLLLGHADHCVRCRSPNSW